MQEIKLEGKHTDAKIFADKVEENAMGQIQKMINHEGFDREVRIMPDTHWGKGAVIGFTMPINHNDIKICPATVGVDIACGMASIRTNLNRDNLNLKELDEEIRDKIPLGMNVHDRNIYHMKNDFPWSKANNSLDELQDSLDIYLETEWWTPHDKYDMEYFRNLCSRTGVKQRRAINSVGTLGGGNHFIEVGEDTQDNIWITVHSGSRGLGAKTAKYWMDRASEVRDFDDIREKIPEKFSEYLKFDPEETSKRDIFEWVTGGKGESHIKYEEIRNDFSGENIQRVINNLKDLNPNTSRNNDLDYLQGKEISGYLIDMNFLQWYARENRRTMLEETNKNYDKYIECIHNYIDFKDCIIRKGAAPARKGEEGIIPMNMADGTFIVEGKGNTDWNCSMPHGAGRVMSRREAKNEIDHEIVQNQMKKVHTSHIPLDEAPDAYKATSMIKNAIQPTAKIKNHINPILNIKA